MKTEKKETPLKPEAKVKPAQLTHAAVGTYKNEKGFWEVVEIPFDPDTKEVGDIVTKSTLATDRASAQESFKLTVIDAVEAFQSPL